MAAVGVVGVAAGVGGREAAERSVWELLRGCGAEGGVVVASQAGGVVLAVVVVVGAESAEHPKEHAVSHRVMGLYGMHTTR
jgi:hypothetical protein